MSSHNEKVSPAPFDVVAAPEQQATTGSDSANTSAPRWVIPSLLVLVVVAGIVVFWLPALIGPKQAAPLAPQQSQGNEATGNTAAAKPAEAPDESSPWSDAQQAKLRKEAQDVLAQLLDIQDQLEERSVDQWAGEAFAAAAVIATEGDQQYRQREFSEAKVSYEQARDAMQALLDSVPAVVDTQLQLAVEAIENREQPEALEALQLAALIEQENARLADLQRRAELLSQLIPLLEQASAAEASGALENAVNLLQQGVKLDPEHNYTAAELERVTAAHIAQQFNDAMSDGYVALDNSRFKSARSDFRRAAKLEPGSAEAASALQEVEDAEIAYRLANLKRSGNSKEQSEQWQQAVNDYEEAAEIDSSVVFAREGLDRSRNRARVDKQFRTTIKKPERLADVAVAEASQALLEVAMRITPRGPVLERQISQLQSLLEKANMPIPVTLQSDEETEVIVYKVARLGRFQQHQLTLRPGTYTAVGTRIGYRDVRQTFTLSHERAAATVVIACREPI